MEREYDNVYSFMYHHKLQEQPENVLKAEKKYVNDNDWMMYIVLAAPAVLNHIDQKHDLKFLNEFFKHYGVTDGNENKSTLELVKPFKDNEFLCVYGMKAMTSARQKREASKERII